MGGSSTSAKKASSLFYAELVEVRVGAEKLSGEKKSNSTNATSF